MSQSITPAGYRPTSLNDKTVVVIGGTSGIGLDTALLARAEGASVVLTGRDTDRLQRAGDLVDGARTAAFDATDHDALAAFFTQLEGPIDHILITAGSPYYAPLADIDLAEAGAAFGGHIAMMIDVARLGCPSHPSRRQLERHERDRPAAPNVGLIVSAATATGLSAAAATLALELAPVRVNVIAAGFIDTPLSARLVGGSLDERRAELRQRLPIRRVVQPGDVAALAVHLMVNTALTGATYDIDGGQQLVTGL